MVHAPREALSTKESERLDQLVGVVRRGMRSFMEVGLALAEIHNDRLYRETHDTFDAFCRETFGFHRAHAHRLIVAVEIANNIATGVSPMGDTKALPLPTSERQVRPLAELAPPEQIEIWRKTAQEAGGIPTAALIEEAVARKLPREQTMRTPRWVFTALNGILGCAFVLDAFASRFNTLLPEFFTKEDDACTKDWPDGTYGNPEFADMVPPLTHAKRQGDLGRRALIVAPAGCSQDWFHEIAIHGTVHVPDCRINWDNPDGSPSDRAMHDTMFVAFGRQWTNTKARDGIFRVKRLPLAHLRPVKS